MNTFLVYNNQGVEKIEAGEYDQAVGVFKRALEIVSGGLAVENERLLVVQQQQELRPTNATMIFCAEESEDHASDFRLEESLSRIQDNFVNQVQPPEMSFSLYVHAHGIRLPSALVIPKKKAWDIENVAILCCILLHNLGLSYHLRGTTVVREGCCQTGSFVLDACACYLKAGALLRRAGYYGTCSSGLAIVDFLVMACLNNLGYGSFQLSDFASAQIYLSHCAIVAKSLDARGPLLHQPVSTQTENLLRLHKSNFVLNAVSLLQAAHSPAA